MNRSHAMSSFPPSTLAGKRVGSVRFGTDATSVTFHRVLQFAIAIGAHAGPIGLGLLIALAANLLPVF